MPAGSTYTPIATTILGSAASSFTFSSIPSTYTDLVIIMSAATTHSSSTFPYLQFNGNTGSNYSATEIYGNGSSALSARDSKGWIGLDISISTTIGDSNSIINIMNYSNTTTYKSWLARSSRASSSFDYQGTNAIVGTWRGSTGSSTEAITSVTLKNSRGGTDYNFASGSIFTLYGIAAA